MADSVALVAGEDDRPLPAGEGEPVSRNVPEPLRDQLVRVLRQDIKAGRRTGKLESERVLADDFGVSVKTIRAALAALADDGLVQSVERLGWFVIQQPGR